MHRRTFLKAAASTALTGSVLGALKKERWHEASQILQKAAEMGVVSSAVLHVEHGEEQFTQPFGKAKSPEAMFLLGSISKPICISALMKLFDKGDFNLDDPLRKFIPQFEGTDRKGVTLRHLMSHVSGLPDQLSENDALRKRHASLPEFVERAIRAPLSFTPGSKYQYSSMGILLATHVAEKITGMEITALVEQSVFKPLEMKNSAQGIGRFTLDDFVPVQTEFAAIEAGGGDPSAKTWDWNSTYWRKLGAPWGGTHASAPDIGRFLAEFLYEKEQLVKSATARLMKSNHNKGDVTPRGLGFGVGRAAGSKGCSDQTFGHTGSTGTLCWADPASKTICVVLTSLPGRALNPHPRELAANKIAAAMQ